jgi:maltose O-acetyltransferase
MIKRLIYNIFNKLRRQANEFEKKQKLARLNISPTVQLFNSDIYGNVEIGEFTYIAPLSVVSSGENSKVVIGKHCAIGRCVTITSKGHSLVIPTSDEDHKTHNHVEKDTFLGDYVWVGDHVFIKHGVTIGDFSIIGANSVVLTDVEDFEIVGGVPAKHIRYNTEHYRYSELVK